jgi:hypothetical protein
MCIPYTPHALFVDADPKGNREAIDMLVHNSQNLVSTMEEVLSATEIATIKLSPLAMDELKLEWIKQTN